jgi:hypothetical protein
MDGLAGWRLREQLAAGMESDHGRLSVNSHTSQVDDVRFVALPSAVSCTDLFVRFSLTEWSLPVLMNDAVFVAQRLVGAVVDRTDPRSPSFVTVRLRLSSEHLVIEVQDDLVEHSPRAPRIEGHEIGVVSFDGRGKRVWCELPLPVGLTAQLPRRDRRRSLVAEQDPGQARGEVDPQLAQRTLAALNRHTW